MKAGTTAEALEIARLERVLSDATAEVAALRDRIAAHEAKDRITARRLRALTAERDALKDGKRNAAPGGKGEDTSLDRPAASAGKLDGVVHTSDSP